MSRDTTYEVVRLQDLASVRTGLVLSRKQSKEPTKYQYSSINLRCIQTDGFIDLNDVDVYEAKEALKKDYLSQQGDVVVRLTAPYTAVLIDKQTSGLVISSNFVVIRIKTKKLIPEYLFWLINTPKIKRQIYRNTTSNMLGAVNSRVLMELELELLSVDVQKKIADLNLLAKKEIRLLKELAEEKEKIYAYILDQAYMRAGNKNDNNK